MKKWTSKLAAFTLGTVVFFSVNGQASAAIYTVKAGDSLSKIAKQHNTSYTTIMKSNNLSSTNIKIGQKLVINEAGKAASTVTTVSNNNSVISIAKKLVGTPYLYGGNTTKGFDCSGFVSYVYKNTGVSTSRLTAAGFYNASKNVSTPKVGDLVFFSGTSKKGISHIGIYIGNNNMISATNSGVKISNIYNSYWKEYFTGFGRI